jgi:hypothetical protein
LAAGRFVDGQVQYRLLDVFFDPILRDRLLAADLLELQFATLVIEFLKTVKTVSGIAHYLASLRDAP